MAIDRRGFLAGLGALTLARPAAAADYLAARGIGTGFAIARFAADGTIRYDKRMPARGHGIAVGARGLSVAIARRPGRFMLAFDVATGAARQRIDAAEGFFFCGHAAFDAAGRLLYATETFEEDGTGHLGVYAADEGFRRVATWPTHGDDPHDLLLLDDGSLVVANGGFGPDGGPSIDPSLVLLDARDGRRLAQAKPPAALRSVSLRHVAVGDRAVFVAGQSAGPARDRPPLVARWDGGALRFLGPSGEALAALSNYCGGIAADRAGRHLCVTSPHGGCALVLDLAGAVVRRLALADVCGVAPFGPDDFILTGGRGDVATTSGSATAISGARWDNHIASIVG